MMANLGLLLPSVDSINHVGESWLSLLPSVDNNSYVGISELRANFMTSVASRNVLGKFQVCAIFSR